LSPFPEDITNSITWKRSLGTQRQEGSIMTAPRFVRNMVMPFKYVQGRGALALVGEHSAALGENAFVVGESVALSLTNKAIRDSLASAGVRLRVFSDSARECTYSAIDRLAKDGTDKGADHVIGVGGGKAMDLAKAVAMKMDVPVVTVGTQCATNADGSHESIVYSDDHEYVADIVLPRNPHAVIEDTDIIAGAPLPFIIQGMGDALACKFEAEAFAKARAKKKDAAVPTVAALALANTCYENLLSKGPKAIEALRKKSISSEVEDIIETVKLISCLAFENTGCALAHALHNGLTKSREVKGQHGEIVAYCTIVQAVYENRPPDQIRQMVTWCRRVGLPTALKDLDSPSGRAIEIAARHVCADDLEMKNMPEEARQEDILRAVKKVEQGNY